MNDWHNRMITPPRLLAFLLLSAGVHAGLLLSTAALQPFHNAESGTMQVQLQKIQSQNSEQNVQTAPEHSLRSDAILPAHQSVPQKYVEDRKDIRNTSGSKPEIARTNSSEKTFSKPSKTPPTRQADKPEQAVFQPTKFELDNNSGQQQRMDLANQVRQRLQKSLQLYLEYPEMARRRGWEGEVRVAVQLSGEGRILDVTLAQSSGHRVLDENTLTTLKNLPRLSWATSLLNGNGMSIELPVIYQLSRL